MLKLILTSLLLLSSGALFAANPIVVMSTTKGDITIELNQEKAPKTVANFLNYVKSGFYSGTVFHRVIPDFMIQAGGFDESGTRLPTKAPVENEAFNGLKNTYGSIAMARTSDPHSATSQFFINSKNNAFLNFKNKSRSGWGYAVFGTVIKGLDVIDKIGAVKTTSKGMHRNWPIENVVINAITLQVDKTEDAPENTETPINETKTETKS